MPNILAISTSQLNSMLPALLRYFNNGMVNVTVKHARNTALMSGWDLPRSLTFGSVLRSLSSDDAARACGLYMHDHLCFNFTLPKNSNCPLPG